MNIGKENEKLEFKKTTAELSESVVSISAILNKCGGGELYFGVYNNGDVHGQQIGDATLRDISQVISNHLEPKIYPKIELVYLDDKPCICVTFSGDNPPYLAYGRAYMRVADEDKQMSAAQLERFILRKNANKDMWDSCPSDKSVGDIDEEILKKYISRSREVGRIDFDYTSKEDVLTRIDALRNGALTNAAAVYFVGMPLLDLQMAIFAGTERITFNDIQRETGSVPQLIKIAERYIRSNIRWRVEFDGSIERIEIPEIPIEAVREAVINSYCHRDYKSSQNNEVCIYSNRVEIYNPGTFPEGLTPDDFIRSAETSVKRNPLLAQLMYYVKDVETFGTGLKRISDACDEAEIKVEFKMSKLGFSVVFYRPEMFNTTETGPGVPTNVPNVPISVPINDPISRRERIIDIIHNNPTITAEELAVTFTVTVKTIKRDLQYLKEKNQIKRIGPNKTGYWVVIE